MNSEIWRPVLLCGLAALVTLYCMVRAWLAFRGARLIAASTPGDIGQLRPGLTEVRGALGGEGQLVAPLSQRPCLYYRLLLEQRRRNKWEPLIDRRRAVKVWLDDTTGVVSIDPTVADVLIAAPKRQTRGIYEVPNDELDALLQRLETQLPDNVNPFVRYREELLESGATLTAVGAASPTETGWALGADSKERLHSVSDWDDAELISRQRRLAGRWFALALAAGAAAAFSLWQVLSSESSPFR